MPHKTGDEILAYCGSCKMDLRATIVAMSGASIARVMCKTCKKERGYRSPKGAAEPGKAPGAASRPRAPREEREVKTVSVFVEWERMMNEHKAAARVPYTVQAALKLNDIIQHPAFGEGYVMKLHHPNKAEVLFRDDIKMLLHSKV
ncbi:MAG: hypothetical protein HYW49_03695 [Deltaproteobacteria bacterium]|nr:hypothetical protein [Deltaproteobacteria bacterium]